MIINIIYFIFAYLLGNVLGGKIISILYKEDFSQYGSGNIGARNAGRILGPKAFLFVATVDIFKGFLIVIMLKLFNAEAKIIAICILLVVLGHIKPIAFGFKGGKGVATFVGTLLALSPNLVFVLILGFLLISFITRSTTIGFYSTLPSLIYIHYLDFRSLTASAVLALVLALLFFVAREDIKKAFKKYFAPVRKRPVKRT
ncbi:glycerol-3-phosphate acyltransferase [Gemella sp. zg-570]|uniref:glycerol-3-phosphate acyltransferase n=1 Tax=Gemella sp. zg-570 TaxID=2840371 RepID=UPI001C0DA32C|nr:glycerol-3-phosphate acyltransferase [Gemella sp. zg-570]QWQ38570.1 glycerol-3-phosphate acyltransferase [Gemella sp. zg-570]